MRKSKIMKEAGTRRRIVTTGQRSNGSQMTKKIANASEEPDKAIAYNEKTIESLEVAREKELKRLEVRDVHGRYSVHKAIATVKAVRRRRRRERMKMEETARVDQQK